MTEEITGNITKLRIGDTSIYLEDFELGKGKIMITGYQNSYTTFWGAMGFTSTLAEFICRIDSDYFANRLTNNKYSFSAKNTVKNVRKYIKEELSYELPWYKFMTAQKELREELRNLESNCENENDFVYSLPKIIDNLMCLEMDWKDEKEFKENLKAAFSEPWHFIGETESIEYRFLKKLHNELVKKLKNNG